MTSLTEGMKNIYLNESFHIQRQIKVVVFFQEEACHGRKYCHGNVLTYLESS